MGLDFNANDVASLVLSAQACEALQDVALAARLYPMLLDTARAHPVLWGPQGTALFGPTLRLAGEMGMIVGRLAEAARHFDEAIELSRRLQLPALVQLCELSRQRLDVYRTPIARLSRTPNDLTQLVGEALKLPRDRGIRMTSVQQAPHEGNKCRGVTH